MSTARRLTFAGLQEGTPGPPGYRVRAARAGDSPAVTRLIGMVAGVQPEAALLAAIEDGIEDGICGEIARRTLGGETDLTTALAESLHGYGGRDPDLYRTLSACSNVLVATRDDREEPIGMCHTIPPGRMLKRLQDTGAPQQAILGVLMFVRRLSSLAVDPGHRHAGVGRVLLDLARRLAFQQRTQLLYGHVRVDTGLADWYRAAGFTVLPPGQGLDMSTLVRASVTTWAGPDEQLFAARPAPHLPVPAATGPAGGVPNN